MKKYYAGIDQGDGVSYGALVLVEHTSDGINIVKVVKWYSKNRWVDTMRIELMVWWLYFKYFRKIKIRREKR